MLMNRGGIAECNGFVFGQTEYQANKCRDAEKKASEVARHNTQEQVRLRSVRSPMKLWLTNR